MPANKLTQLTQAESILNSLNAYATECEQMRLERSAALFGHTGAHVDDVGPTRAGRLAAIQAALDGAPAPAPWDGADALAVTQAAMQARLDFESMGPRLAALTTPNPNVPADRPWRIYTVFFDVSGKFIAAHGSGISISTRDGLTSEAAREEFLRALAARGAAAESHRAGRAVRADRPPLNSWRKLLH